jgi:hypothetical protein
MVLSWFQGLFRNLVHACVVSKNTLIMNKVDIIAFISKVINTIRVVESINTRLKVIVEMAKEILGLTDVTVEMVVDMLNNPKGGVFQHDIDLVLWGWGGCGRSYDLFGFEFYFHGSTELGRS